MLVTLILEFLTTTTDKVAETPGFDSAGNEEVLECGLAGYYVPPQLRGDDTPFCAPTNSANKPASGYWGRDHGE